MTNQEAQTALANLKRYMSGGGAVDRVTNKAIDMAIKALEQPEPCEDAVSRKAAIAQMQGLPKWNGIIANSCVDFEDVISVLENKENLPPVTPKQRTGYWYPVGMAEVVGGESAQWGSAIAYHRCSECDEQALRDDFEQEVLSEFCPHCGVKMEGVAE